MCYFVAISGVSSFEAFRAHGFDVSAPGTPDIDLALGPHWSFVTRGGCSCDFYTNQDPSARLEQDRQRLARKGWSSAKIERALKSRMSEENPVLTNFLASLSEIAESSSSIRLLCHCFSGSVESERFEVQGEIRMSLSELRGASGHFPTDTVVQLQLAP